MIQIDIRIISYVKFVFQMATGKRRWYIVGCYLVPGDGTTIKDIEAAMAEYPRGADLIVAGDLNVELGKAGSRVRYK